MLNFSDRELKTIKRDRNNSSYIAFFVPFFFLNSSFDYTHHLRGSLSLGWLCLKNGRRDPIHVPRSRIFIGNETKIFGCRVGRARLVGACKVGLPDAERVANYTSQLISMMCRAGAAVVQQNHLPCWWFQKKDPGKTALENDEFVSSHSQQPKKKNSPTFLVTMTTKQ